MPVGEGDAGVDETSSWQHRARLLRGGLEGEVREEDRGCVVCQVDVEDVGGGVVDRADDEFARPGYVLQANAVSMRSVDVSLCCFVHCRKKGRERKRSRWLTRPPVVSTRMAFLLCSAMSWPATVGRIASGGACRRPGPRRRGF